MRKDKVVLGMSGGVDSTVAALLLQRQGFEVVGFMMNCDPLGNSKLPSTINWIEEERELGKICIRLGIELHVHDCEIGYGKKVIGKMISDYARGLTPNPDTLCNKIGKFPKMLKLASEVGAGFIATGHYARVRKGEKGFELLQGTDERKDQSYFLCDLNQKILSRVIFPVGNFSKEEVRKIARENGFVNWDKRSSRGICYLGKIDVKQFLREKIPEKRGNVILSTGEIVGEHPGVFYFTIGERVKESDKITIDRKRVGSGEKFYVADKLSGNKLVIAGFGSRELKRKKIFLKSFRTIIPSEKKLFGRYGARIRHLGEKHYGSLSRESGKIVFTFDKGIEGVASGQICVLYDGNKVFGSGEIRVR